MAVRVSRARGLRLFRLFLRKEAIANGWPPGEVRALFGKPFARLHSPYVAPGG